MSNYEDYSSKYEKLVEKASTISSVGNKIVDMAKQNQSSIEWYRKQIELDAAEGKGENSYYAEAIERLEREIPIMLDLEDYFWKKYVF